MLEINSLKAEIMDTEHVHIHMALRKKALFCVFINEIPISTLYSNTKIWNQTAI